MSSTVAYAVGSPTDRFVRTTIERREVGPHDVSIAVAFAGICHSDIHTARSEWGSTHYPLVPGHEIAGIVDAVGSEVTDFTVGDRVGVGCLVNSCGECRHCQAGEEQFCPKRIGTYAALDLDGTWTAGGYSQNVVVNDRFVLRIPDSLALDAAAPLLCAGITTYSPLRHWKAGPGTRMGVIGLGGLGHMAVQFGHALGAEVTLFSRTLAKEEDARALGADHVVATADINALRPLASSFDLIINTVSAGLPFDNYLRTLDVDGALVNVGLPPEPTSLKIANLIGNRRTLAGSPIGGIRETQEMLDFAAEHDLGARIELIGAEEIDEAYDRVVAGTVRYRYVIDTASIV